MFIDEKGKLFGKLSIIDFIVIAILVLSILGGIFMYFSIENKKLAPGDGALISHQAVLSDLDVTLVLENVRSMTKDALEVGDEVFSDETGKYFGEITKIESKPYQDVLISPNGTAVLADKPERFVVSVHVRLKGEKTDNGFFTSENLHLACGEAFPIKTVNIQAIPDIENIEVIMETEAETEQK